MPTGWPRWMVPTTRCVAPGRRTRAPGRVELDQQRNAVTAYTRGVSRFTLLISPEQFDFTQPISVAVNGVTVFDGMVEPDIEELLHWAAIDQDRTAMYGAELDIEVPAAP